MAQQTDHVPEVRNMLTAVEWFYDRLKWVNRDVYNEMTTQFDGAKQMEKEQMKSIELPSDEEIENAATHLEPSVTRRAFQSGAKWMRDKILNK